MWTRRALLTFCYLLFLVFFGFQNCAKIQFTDNSSGEEVISPVEPEEPALAQNEGPTNGEGFDGKVTRYIHFSEPGECDVEGSVPKDIIEKLQDNYDLILENCEEIPVRNLPASEIIENDKGLQYQNRDFFIDYPQSCFEIYDSGGDNPNGLYLILAPGETEPEPQYCNMDFVALGWSHWQDWSVCSTQCGIGEQTRTRTCQSGNCSGNDIQTRTCESFNCGP